MKSNEKTSYRERLFNIGNKEGLKTDTLRQYIDFMEKRFPESEYLTIDSYAQEWALRFKKPNLTSFMDSKSLKVYQEVQ